MCDNLHRQEGCANYQGEILDSMSGAAIKAEADKNVVSFRSRSPNLWMEKTDEEVPSHVFDSLVYSAFKSGTHVHYAKQETAKKGDVADGENRDGKGL